MTCFVYGAVTRYGRTFQNVPLARRLPRRGPTTPPRPEPRRFGLIPVRSPLLGESFLFSLPAGTKMFQFPAYASALKADSSPSGCWVVPFGNPRINGHLRLPAAYRSLSRPSSPAGAKASTVRPFLLASVRRPHITTRGTRRTSKADKVSCPALSTRCHLSSYAYFYLALVLSFVSVCTSMSKTDCPKGKCGE